MENTFALHVQESPPLNDRKKKIFFRRNGSFSFCKSKLEVQKISSRNKLSGYKKVIRKRKKRNPIKIKEIEERIERKERKERKEIKKRSK